MPDVFNSWPLLVIAVGSLVIMTIFWLQYYGVPPIFKRMLDKSSEERTAELVTSYFQNLSQKEQQDPATATPHLRPLKAIEQDDIVKCIFGNRGGTAYNLSVNPIGNIEVEIEPAESLSSGETGIITLKKSDASPIHSYQFTLLYTDSNRQKIRRHYLFNAANGELTEL